jgi:hypothetical protein
MATEMRRLGHRVGTVTAKVEIQWPIYAEHVDFMRSGTRETGRRIAVACTAAACSRSDARRPEAADGPKGAPSSSGSSTGRGR